jgi:hypothetical protein
MRLAAASAALILALAPQAHSEPVAVTFDDVPYLSLTTDLDYQKVTTHELLAGLRRNHIVAIGFVNEIKDRGHRADNGGCDRPDAARRSRRPAPAVGRWRPLRAS